MRVASYNIHRAIGTDGRQSPERIARVLQELRADVVALQEVAYQADGVSNVLDYLAMAAQAEPIEGKTLHDNRGAYGNGVLSRAPVLSVEQIDLSVRNREPRGAIALDISLGTWTAQILATHLGLRPRERRAQVDRLLATLESSNADVQLLLGDFNEWLSWGRPLRSLKQVLGPCSAPATFPSSRPWLALDRIWARPADVVRSVRAHVSETSRVASDHLPLVAELELERLRVR